MTRIEIQSRVGPDGVLNLSVPVGPAEANRTVKVTVEGVKEPEPKPSMTPEEWKAFIDSTAGSITDPTFKRHDQGEYEDRGEIFP
jgi:hypothetical protein